MMQRINTLLTIYKLPIDYFRHMRYNTNCGIITEKEYAFVAQGIELWFPVPRVGGSSPSGCIRDE
jgi:hypothetical protein